VNLPCFMGFLGLFSLLNHMEGRLSVFGGDLLEFSRGDLCTLECIPE
jgi:hypothetical protein